MSPRTSDQLQELRENRKQQILQAALKVFANQGYNGATINMIAKEAGMAKGLLYSYYESKEKLLEALIEFGLEKATYFLSQNVAGKPGSKAAFANGLRNIVQLFQQETDFWRLYCMLILQPSLSKKFKQKAGHFMEAYLQTYVAYFKKKKSRNPIAEAMLFGAILDGLMFDLMLAPGVYPLDDVVDMIIEKFA